MSEAWQRAITPAVAAALRGRGFAVVDGLFGSETASCVREELLALRRAQLMQVNATHLVRDGVTQKLSKSGIWEAEGHLLTDEGRRLAGTLAALAQDRTLLTMLNVMLGTNPAEALRSQTLKMQVNDGGGSCFPLHHDADVALDGRRVTALYYANPAWVPGDGGELVLYPSLEGARVAVPPLHDRLVLFSAPSMLHRVAPHRGAQPRCCFTLWLFARDLPPSLRQARERAAGAAGTAHGARATVEALMRPEYRKHAFKAVLCDEWAASIAEAHPESAARDAAVQTLWDEVALITRVLDKELSGAAELIQSLRRRRQLPVEERVAEKESAGPTGATR